MLKRGRKKLPKAKKRVGIASKVRPVVKEAIGKIAESGHRTESQTIELLIEESPRVQALLPPESASQLINA